MCIQIYTDTCYIGYISHELCVCIGHIGYISHKLCVCIIVLNVVNKKLKMKIKLKLYKIENYISLVN